MTIKDWDQELFELMQSEHRELAEVLVQIRDAVSVRVCTKIQLEDLMTRLCELVESHFNQEEQGGYLKEALDRAPHYAAKAESLLAEHRALQEDVEKIRLLVHSGVESSAWWIHINSDFNNFASQLQNHEHAEVQVLQGAFTEDIGTKD